MANCSKCQFSSSSANDAVFTSSSSISQPGPFICAKEFRENKNFYLRKVIQLGDLLEFCRSFYKHWAIYVGNGYVIHFTGQDAGIAAKSYITAKTSGKGPIQEDSLDCVIGNDSFRVNNLTYQAHKKGLIALNTFDVLGLAHKLVGTRPEYNLLKNNCEHLVTLLKYGEKFSVQVEETAAIATATATAGATTGGMVGGTVVANKLTQLLNTSYSNIAMAGMQITGVPVLTPTLGFGGVGLGAVGVPAAFIFGAPVGVVGLAVGGIGLAVGGIGLAVGGIGLAVGGIGLALARFGSVVTKTKKESSWSRTSRGRR